MMRPNSDHLVKWYLVLGGLILWSTFSRAQDYIDSDKISINQNTVRSINVDLKKQKKYTLWCSYSIAQSMELFLDQKSRDHFREDAFWNINDQTASCLWMQACHRAWEKNETILESVAQASKAIQYQAQQNKNKGINAYNIEAQKEKKPFRSVSKVPMEFHGNTDLSDVQFVHIPLEKYISTMVQDCVFYQISEGVEFRIKGELDKSNPNQDRAFVLANQYARGLLMNIHYRFDELVNNHILFTPRAKIYSGYYLYDLDRGLWNKDIAP